MKRILPNLILAAFAALAIAAAAFALRPRDDRERLISAPLFPDAPRIVPTGTSFGITAFSPAAAAHSFNFSVVTGLDVEVLRLEPASPPESVLLAVGAGTPAAERLRAFLDGEDLDRLKWTKTGRPDALLGLQRNDPPPREGEPSAYVSVFVDADDPGVRDFLARFHAAVAETEAEAAARNAFRAETNAFFVRYYHQPAPRSYEHQTKLNKWLSDFGLVSKKTENVPVPKAWTDTPAFRLSGFSVVAVSNAPVPARWFGDPADIGWLQLDAASPAAERLRAFLEKRRPWESAGGPSQTSPLNDADFYGDGIGPTGGWRVTSPGQAPDLVDLVLDLRRLLLDSPE